MFETIAHYFGVVNDVMLHQAGPRNFRKHPITLLDGACDVSQLEHLPKHYGVAAASKLKNEGASTRFPISICTSFHCDPKVSNNTKFLTTWGPFAIR